MPHPRPRRVLVVGVEPGGAQCAAAVARAFLDAGHEVSSFGRGPGARRFEALGVPCEDLDPSVAEDAQAEALVARIRPDLVVTGTSMGSFLERRLWETCRKHAIPSACVLDAWFHVGVRFTWRSFREVGDPSTADHGEVAPDLVFCPDEEVLTEVRAALRPPSRAFATGHPWLEWCSSRWRHAPTADGIRRILFLSEPAAADYGRDYWGFDEREVLELLLESLPAGPGRPPLELLVRPHPRESAEEIAGTLDRAPRGVSWTWATTGQVLDHASGCDLVCGMTSMALLESRACGCPTLSILPGLRRASPYLPDLRGWDRSVRSPHELAPEILRRLDAPPSLLHPAESHRGAALKILERLELIP